MSEPQQIQTERLETSLTSNPRWLPVVRGIVSEAAGVVGLDREAQESIALAVNEAWTNVIRHVYGGREDARIDLAIELHPDRLATYITDYGTFVDPGTIRSRRLEDVRPGGIGVHLIKTTMDDVEYKLNEHGGTTLSMVRYLESHA